MMGYGQIRIYASSRLALARLCAKSYRTAMRELFLAVEHAQGANLVCVDRALLADDLDGDTVTIHVYPSTIDGIRALRQSLAMTRHRDVVAYALALWEQHLTAEPAEKRG